MSIAFKQARGIDPGSGTNFSLAYSSNNVAGSLLYCGVSLFAGFAPGVTLSVTDSQGNVWNLIQNLMVGNTVYGATFYAANCKAGANTVTVHSSATVNAPFCIAEYSGLAASSPLDAFGQGSGLATTITDSGGQIISQANEVLIGFEFSYVNSQVFTAGAGYRKRVNDGVNVCQIEDQIVSALGSYHATGSLAGAGSNWIQTIETFGVLPVTHNGGWVNTHRDFANKRGLE